SETRRRHTRCYRDWGSDVCSSDLLDHRVLRAAAAVHVFILSRIKEPVDRGRRTEDAVVEGIKATAGTVTSAAIVMVAVFGIFAKIGRAACRGRAAVAVERQSGLAK